MKESKLFKSLLATIVVVALGAPVIASAGNKNELKGVSVKVSYADLNLEKKAGAQVLYRRLQNAAKQACDVRSLRVEGSLSNIAESRRCYRGALSAAVEQIDNEIVTNIHDS